MTDYHHRFRQFAADKTVPQTVGFVNRKGEKISLVCRQLTGKDYEQVHDFEQKIMDGILNNDVENIYQPFDEPGLRKALDTGWAMGLYHVGTDAAIVEAANDNGSELQEAALRQCTESLAAFLYVIPHPEINYNVLTDVAQELGLRQIREDGTVEFSQEVHDVMIADCILVGKEYRGYGLQRALFYLADCMAAEEGISRLCGTASPKNGHSIRNFESAGYRCVAVKPKYRSERCFFVKKVVPLNKK